MVKARIAATLEPAGVDAVAGGRPEMPGWASNLFLLFFALRICLPSPLLNMVVNYEASQDGIILEKIHPGSWTIVAMGIFVVPVAAKRIRGADRKTFDAILLYLVLIGAVIAESIMLGRTGSIGYLLDSLITAGVAGMIVLVMSERKKRAVANIVLAFCLFNCAVSITEFVGQFHFLPGSKTFSVFRPNGIAGHPLETGLWCVLSYMLLWFVRWPLHWKVVAALVILIGAASAGARLATAVLFATSAIALILPPLRSRLVSADSVQNMLVMSIVTLIAAPFAYFLVDSLGILYRFSALGFFDESAESRVRIYDVFSLIDRSELLYGLPIETATELLFRLTKSKLIESSVAIYVFQFGLIGAALLLLGFVVTLIAFLRRANRFLIVLILGFWVAAGGTLVLSGKSACLTALFCLCVALSKPAQRAAVPNLRPVVMRRSLREAGPRNAEVQR